METKGFGKRKRRKKRKSTGRLHKTIKLEDGVYNSRSDDSSMEDGENGRKREVYSPQKPRRLRMLERDESFLLVPGKSNRVFVEVQLTKVEPIVDLSYYMAHIEDKLAVEIEPLHPQRTNKKNSQGLKETNVAANKIEEVAYHTGKNNNQQSPKKKIISKDGSSSEKKFRRIKSFEGSSSSEDGTYKVESLPAAEGTRNKDHSEKHQSNDQVNEEKSTCKEKDESQLWTPQHFLKYDQNY